MPPDSVGFATVLQVIVTGRLLINCPGPSTGWARRRRADVTVPSMATLLHLDSSADLAGSVSRRLTARFAAGWAALGHAIVRRDLFLDQPPHLPSSVLHWAPSLRATDESVDRAHDLYQEELVGELLAADVVLVGAPMYN